MPIHPSPDDVRRSVRRDLDRSLRTGAPPLGHLAGIHRVPAQDGSFALALDNSRPLLAGGPGIAEVAMLADLALGGVIRDRVGRALPLPTISMTLQIAPGRTSEVTRADGDCSTRGDRTSMSRVRLRSAPGEVIGDAQGVFALPALPYDGPARAMPWDSADTDDPDDPGGDVTSSVLGASDAPLVNGLVEHTAGDPRCAWGTTHVMQQLDLQGDVPTLTPSTVMANRLGHVQGGVLLTTAVLAVAHRGGFPVATLVTATIDFIDPARLDTPLAAEVSISRTSRRSLFATVLLLNRARPCSQVTAVFRR